MSEDANEFAVRLKGWIDLFCREIADLKDRVAVLEKAAPPKADATTPEEVSK
jgi:hypothetical protein